MAAHDDETLWSGVDRTMLRVAGRKLHGVRDTAVPT
jgi:hypothetical protein